MRCRFLQRRMKDVRSDFGQRDKDKIPAGHSGMGYDEIGSDQYRFFGQEDVEVDGPGPVNDGSCPPHFFFNRLKKNQERPRRKGCFDLDDLIDKPGPTSRADRLGLEERRSSENF